MDHAESPDTRTPLADVRAWSAAFEHAPDGVGICDEDGRFVSVNDRLARLVDQPRDEMIGRPFLRFVHPDDRPSSLAGYFRSVVAAAADSQDRPPEQAELRCLTRTGATIWLQVRWTMTSPDEAEHQYGIVHLRDITGRRPTDADRGETDHGVTDHHARLAFDSSPTGIALAGPDGKLTRANPAMTHLLGYREHELQQLTFADLLHPDERAGHIDWFQRLTRGTDATHRAVARHIHRDGHVIQLRRTATAAQAANGATRYMLLQLEPLT